MYTYSKPEFDITCMFTLLFVNEPNFISHVTGILMSVSVLLAYFYRATLF